MGETTLQDHRLAAAARTSNTYTNLKTTALAFISAQKQNPDFASKVDFDALRSVTTQGYSHTFGPSYSVTQAPRLQGVFDFDAFVQHLQSMLPMLDRWEVQVKGTAVDEVGASVVVRATYTMYVKGAEGVENDVVWWLELEEVPSGSGTGEGHGTTNGGWKVRKSTEIVDSGASARIKELMVGGKDGVRRKDSAAVAE